MFFSVLFCYAFMHACLLMPCGYLLGKGWPLGTRLWCLIVTLSLSNGYPGSGAVLYCIDSWSLPSFLLKSLLLQGLLEPQFYGDLVYKLKKIVGSNNFTAQFIKIFFILRNSVICQPNHSWQLSFPVKLHAGRSDLRLYDGSELMTYL